MAKSSPTNEENNAQYALRCPVGNQNACQSKLGGVEFPKHLDGTAVLRVSLQGLLIVGDRRGLVAVVHVTFREAVVDIAGLRIGLDIQLENTDRFLELFRANELVAQAVQFVLIEVVRGRFSGLQ